MLNWDKLRSDPDVRSSFEELCCQLARHEVPEDSQFVRKAPPDAGIECFCRLHDGSEWGWQAKYFTESPSDQQWHQIDDSVKKALETHPNLTKYFVCLPVNRSDARMKDRRSYLDKWNEHVTRWKQIKDVEFEYWGTSEIEDMLSNERHSGRMKYFFDTEFLSHDWFDKHLKKAIANAGPRYSSILNVDLPITANFEALGRTKKFHNILKQIPKNIYKDFNYCKSSKTILETESEFNDLNRMIDSITDILKTTDEIWQKAIEFENICKNCENAVEVIDKIISKLKEKTSKNKERHKNEHQRHETEDFSNKIYHLQKLQIKLSKLQKLSKSNFCLVANTGALLLVGDAGNGKTHLLCDVANSRISLGLFSILLHGGHFTSYTNPERQILDDLGLSCTFDEFLVALNAAGQASNYRILIMIDALNEGAGRHVWPKYLAGLLEDVSEYPWISIAVSVRTSYEKAVIPKHIGSEKLSKVTHYGFAGRIEEAVKIFFDGNGIERPRVPLLVHEFSNPQFLLILCKGLKNRHLTRIPNELKGLTSVYDFFIDAINEKLADVLDYPEHQKIVRDAVYLLAKRMASKNIRSLLYQDADRYLKKIHPSTKRSESLIHHLISEGILSEEHMRGESGTYGTFVQFAYERLGDNLIIKNQLKNITTKKNIATLFCKTGSFAKYFTNCLALIKHKGMIDAISIQFPEKFKQELIEINPKLANDDVVLESFLDSFMWRHPNSIGESSLLQIEKHVLSKRRHLSRFFKMILTVSADPTMPLNGEFLHKYLSGLDMGDRDSVWSTFLHYDYYEEDSIVRRYIDWARNDNKSGLLPKSFYLAGLTLSWFLTSSNRLVRDRATKALVLLLSGRMKTLMRILKKFARCNDLYVVERLFCVAYGCAMRSDNKLELKNLADYTYSTIFKNANPPPNILLRDYARCIIDYTLHKEIKLDVDRKKLNPPYCSKWIQHFPTEEDIEKLRIEYSKTPSCESDYGALQIFNSLGHMGDFYHYIIKTNFDSFENSPRLLSKNRSRETVFEEFKKSITNEQKTLWENYYTFVLNKERCMRIRREDRKRVFGFAFEDDEFNNVVKIRENNLREELTTKQRRIFNKCIVPYLEYSFNQEQPQERQDLRLFAQWIVRRVFEFGWTRDRFGQFDQNVSRHESSIYDGKPERIGKKYQWLAYSELFARASDNFEFNDDSGKRAFKKYYSPLQIMGGRDIDPSLLISKTFAKEVYAEPYSRWWFPLIYDILDSQNDDVEWLKDESNLPTFESIIEVKSEDGSKWLVLGSCFRLQQKIPTDQESSEIPLRDIFFCLDSCLAKKSDISKLYRWGRKQSYQGARFPEFDHTYDTFLGELYWEKSVQQKVNRGEPNWTRQGERSEEIPTDVYVPMYQYTHESGGYDCSIDTGFHILLPNKLLVEKMNLINKVDGIFVDSNDKKIAYDPSVSEKGPSMLLIRKDSFVKFLQDNDYGIIWQVIGKKIVLGGEITTPEEWKGSLDMHGVYRITNGKVEGDLKTQYVNRELVDRRNEEG